MANKLSKKDLKKVSGGAGTKSAASIAPIAGAEGHIAPPTATVTTVTKPPASLNPTTSST